MQTLIQGVSGQEVHLAGSLVNRITGARLTSSATARVSIDGTWDDAAGTLDLEETDQWKYTLHDDEADATELVIAVDHADAVEPLIDRYTLLSQDGWWRHIGGTFNERGGRIWFVNSSTGDSANPGTSSAPYDDIADAIAVAQNTDTIRISGDFEPIAASLTISIDGLTLDGDADTSTSIVFDGVGNTLNISSNSVTLKNLSFEHSNGESALNADLAEDLTLYRCLLRGDATAATITSARRVTCVDCEFDTDTGDVVNIGGSRNVEFIGCNFSTTGAGSRGIVAVTNGAGPVVIRKCYFHNISTNATATTAIRFASDPAAVVPNGSLLIENCLFSTNILSGDGDAIAVQVDSGAVSLRDCEIHTSAAGAGSAIDISAASGSQVTIEGLSANRTKFSGAGTIIDLDTLATTISSKLPTKSTLAGTNNIDGDIQMNDATGNFPGSVNSVVGNVGGNVVGFVSGVTGNVSGRLLGNGATAFAGVGVRADNRDGQDIAATGDQMNLTDGAITANKIASAALTAAKFASGAFDSVWSTTERLLTAGTNIVLAKGIGVTGFNDLSAAQVNAEVDTAIGDADLPNATANELLSTLSAIQNSAGSAEAAATTAAQIAGDIQTKTDLLDFTGTSGALKSESTNMRGTDGANTVTPNNAGIAAAQSAAESAATTTTTINTKIGTPQTTLADDIGDIQAGGVTIPVIQVPVPASRTWILKPGDGLRGELPIVREVGESQPYAVDFRNDLPNNGRLISLDSIVVEGTENGIVIDPSDQGVDRSQAKFNIEALLVGTYVITVTASYDDSDGGGTSIGEVTLIVKA
jgi:hypothetical protein